MAEVAAAAASGSAKPVSVVEDRFLTPHPTDLLVVRKMLKDVLTEGNFAVTDMNNNMLFQVKGKLVSIRDRRTLRDASGTPLVTLRPKMVSAHDRWQAFKGESVEDKDLLFTVKRSSLIQLKTKMLVYLAANETKEADFRVEGSWLDRSCIIYAGGGDSPNSNTIIAQMHKKHDVGSLVLGKDKFMVTVYPYVDHAFIVSLIVVLNAVNKGDSD